MPWIKTKTKVLLEATEKRQPLQMVHIQKSSFFQRTGCEFREKQKGSIQVSVAPLSK